MKILVLFIGSRPDSRSLAEHMPSSKENMIFYIFILVLLLVTIVFEFVQRKKRKKDDADLMLDKIQKVRADVEEFLDFFKKQKKILENVQNDLVKMEEKKKDLKAILKDDGSAVRALLNVQKRSKYWGYAIAFLIGILSKGAYDLIIYLFNSN